ncbi:hypothetical protein AB0C96_40140 [Streptomyces sp. NPDC048506]|uniref:NucA/NucB deoxyribonuclease domain-containing protein n=1 Tax=Streptomyces sp. NPDC048506 TaxID=3155028 RepID=UPI00343A4565
MPLGHVLEDSVQKDNFAQHRPFAISSRDNSITHHKPVLIVTSTAPGYLPSTGSLPAMRTVRCDSEQVTNSGRRGCVYPSIVPNLSISRANPQWGAMAKHVYQAERTLLGQPGYAKPLHRAPPAQAKANRRKTCPSRLPRPRGRQCDEYPYASAQEGGGVIGLTQPQDDRHRPQPQGRHTAQQVLQRQPPAAR